MGLAYLSNSRGVRRALKPQSPVYVGLQQGPAVGGPYPGYSWFFCWLFGACKPSEPEEAMGPGDECEHVDHSPRMQCDLPPTETGCTDKDKPCRLCWEDRDPNPPYGCITVCEGPCMPKEDDDEGKDPDPEPGPPEIAFF